MKCTKCQKEVEYLWEYKGEFICQECCEEYSVEWKVKDGELLLVDKK